MNTVPPTGASFEETVYKTAVLKVPGEATIAAYKAASGWSEFLRIEDNTVSGVSKAIADDLSVRGIDGAILVDEGCSASEIAVYSTAGKVVYSGPAKRVEVPARLYVVVAGKHVRKVAVR